MMLSSLPELRSMLDDPSIRSKAVDLLQFGSAVYVSVGCARIVQVWG
jgi:hypothetical protein